MSNLPVGTKLQGNSYTVGILLAQGGFGLTYRGSDTLLRRQVAIKEFFPQGCSRRGFLVTPGLLTPDIYQSLRQKFKQEAQTLATLDHPGIVRVHACVEQHNTVYMVMELLKGHTLQTVVETWGPLAEATALDITAQVGAALTLVHERGLIHGDINPCNVMLEPGRRAVLIDFGLNRKLEEDTTYSTRPLSKSIPLGTLGYAPLEQHSHGGRVGVFTDIYALGATLYFLLTGKVPLEALHRHEEELPPPHTLKPQISRGVSESVMQAMALKSKDRPSSVQAFHELLFQRAPGTAPSPGAARRRWWKRSGGSKT